MNRGDITRLRAFFRTRAEIKLVYLFGSRSRQEQGMLSDYDFALYLDTTSRERMQEIRIDAIVKIGRLFKTDKVDVVVLNLTDNLDLKYLIVKEGRLIYEKEPFKVVIEPIILNEYFDFHKMLARYKLTRSPV